MPRLLIRDTRAGPAGLSSSKGLRPISSKRGWPYQPRPLRLLAYQRYWHPRCLSSKRGAAESDHSEEPNPLESVYDQHWEELKQVALNPFSAKAQLDDQNKVPLEVTTKHQSACSEGWAASLWSHLSGRVLFNYYNWRQDSWSDLQLFLLLNISILLVGASVKYFLLDYLSGDSAGRSLWRDIYEVVVLAFGENFPDAASQGANQAFSLAIAAAGLVSFALVLALVEQVVMENVEQNVKKGSAIVTSGHVVLLMWGVSQRDMEMAAKILSQACLAYQGRGGATLVVLSQREKLDMESHFRRVLPDSLRFGSSLIFRQGSPLVGEDLRMVAATACAATIIVSDSSRQPDEADAQAVRAAILLDELDFPGFGQPDFRTGDIVVELKTTNALPLLQANCSRRIVGVPTNVLNARRLARMFEHPIVADVSKSIWSFHSRSQIYVKRCPPRLRALRFGDLFKWYPDGIVLGLLNRRTGSCLIAPAPSTQVEEGHDLIMVRPTKLPGQEYHAAQNAAIVELTDHLQNGPGDRWQEGAEAPEKGHPHHSSSACNGAGPCQTAFAASNGASTAQHADQDPACHSVDGYYVDYSGHEPIRLGAAGHANAAGVGDSPDVLHGRRFARLDSAIRRAGSRTGVPQESTLSDVPSPRKCLICGWGEASFMSDVLRELDRGPCALPRGTVVTLLNMHEEQAVMRPLHASCGPPRNIQLQHIRGNPLIRSQLDQLRISDDYNCVLVMADYLWLDDDGNAANGVEHALQRDYLRIDSMVMMTQLAVRHIMASAGSTSINIICEKVAFQGVTRFEDRHRLPLGVSVNFTSHAAKLLTQVAFNPKALMVVTSLQDADLGVCDSSEFAAEGEVLSFWQLQMRVQAGGQVLLGYFVIPSVVENPINAVINPAGDAERSAERVWNAGDQRLRLIICSNPELQMSKTASNGADIACVG